MGERRDLPQDVCRTDEVSNVQLDILFPERDVPDNRGCNEGRPIGGGGPLRSLARNLAFSIAPGTPSTGR
jgi:hypothetical protein